LTFETLHEWNIKPSPEDRLNMSPGQVIEFIKTAIGKVRHEDGFIHHGLDSLVSES
jgi:hypothetical protein